MEIIALDSLESLAEKSLEYLKGPLIAVSGGTTFAALFRHWLPSVKKRVDAGELLRFFPVDERKVSFEDSQCNWKTCYDELLAPAGLAEQKRHYVITAAAYGALLQQEFKNGPVIFDQIFLGMGEDGHTASLFPGGVYLNDFESIVLDVVGPKPPPERVTLGFRPIRECKTLIAIALGPSKANLVAQLRRGTCNLPIATALNSHAHSILLVDKAAAGE